MSKNILRWAKTNTQARIPSTDNVLGNLNQHISATAIVRKKENTHLDIKFT
jgi:hypothetical protein